MIQYISKKVKCSEMTDMKRYRIEPRRADICVRIV